MCEMTRSSSVNAHSRSLTAILLVVSLHIQQSHVHLLHVLVDRWQMQLTIDTFDLILDQNVFVVGYCVVCMRQSETHHTLRANLQQRDLAPHDGYQLAETSVLRRAQASVCLCV